MKKTKIVPLFFLVIFSLSTNISLAKEQTTFQTNKARKGQNVKPKVKHTTHKTKSKASQNNKKIVRKGQSEVGVLVEPTALE